MSGLFGTLNNATKSLSVQQAALQTTSHNISNANTEGYSRQRVNLQADNPYNIGGGNQLGTGVRIASVERVVDTYVNTQLQIEQSSLETYSQKSDVLGQLEAIFNEPSTTGLNNSISEVFASWTYLGSNPEMATAKGMVAQNTETFTDTLHHMSTQISKLKDATMQDIGKDVMDFNTKLEQLDSLNKQVFNVSLKGQSPNDLLDQRDKALSELTKLAGVDATYDQYNRVNISIGGEEILSNNTLKTLSAADGELLVDDKNVEITSGSIRGSQEALTEIDNKQDGLNQLAQNFATAVNTIHKGGPEDAGIGFFEIGDSSNAASSITVNKVILNDVSKINAGKTIGENAVGGDGTRAQAIASLQNTRIKSLEDIVYFEDTMKIADQAGGSTVSGTYNNLVTEMGIVKQQADNMVESQGSLVSLLQERRESISGVSINEEVTDTIRYQSAFQANSRVISVVSEMLDTLINRTGV